MKKPAVAGKLIESLNTRIVTGEYPIGSKLPSLRLLARRFKISYSSALVGIDYLEAQGKLLKDPRRGVFVRSRTSRRNRLNGDRQLALVAPHFKSLNGEVAGLFQSALAAIEKAALENDYLLQVTPLPNLKTLPPAVLRQLNTQCRGIIMMKEIDEWLSEWPFTVPAVGLLMENDYGGAVSLVGIDPYQAAGEAANFFLHRGIENVYVVYVNYPCYALRAKLFELAFREVGGRIAGRIAQPPLLRTPVDCFIPDAGYFFASDNTLYNAVGNQKIKYPDRQPDFSRMIAIDGKNFLMPWEPKFPSIGLDWALAGRTAFEECLALINEPGRIRRRIYLMGKLQLPTESEK